MVPLHEEHTARLERGIKLDDWSKMELEEKALVIANRRIRIAVDNLQADAEIKSAKRNAKRSGK
jgi:cell division protein FtsL